MKIKVVGKQQNCKMCLVCGLKNPFGLKASFYELENDEVVAIFRPLEEHQGYPGRLHGGIASAILDEAIGRAVIMRYDEEVWGVTVDFSIVFRKPIPLNEELKVVGRVTEAKSRFFSGTGEIILGNGDVAATGTGRYMKLPIEKIGNFDYEENEWKVVAADNDPEYLELPGR
jgi:acyl-coenzyme A thioesterase PaaI-like protein